MRDRLRQLDHRPDYHAPATPPIGDYGDVGRPMWDPGHEDGWKAVRSVWRRKGLVLAVLAASVVAAVGGTALIAPRYSAEARILVGIPDPHVANIESVLRGVAPNSDTMQSEAYVVASRQIARQVAERLALDKVPEFNPALRHEDPGILSVLAQGWRETVGALRGQPNPETAAGSTNEGAVSLPEEEDGVQREWDAIVATLLDHVEAVQLNRSHVLSIVVWSEDPVLAARIANGFGTIYVEQNLVRKQRAVNSANTWLQGRITELQGNVQRSERAVEEFRRENGLYETKSDTIVAQQLAALNRDLVAAENAKADAAVRLAQASAQVGQSSSIDSLPAVLQSPLMLNLRGRQAELERQAAELSSTYTSKHPRMRDIRAQIRDLKQKIDGVTKRVVTGLRHEARMAEESYNRVAARMEELKSRMGVSNEKSVKLRELEREAQANRSMLDTLLLRSKETVDQQGIQTANTEVISRASVPFGPSFPPTAVILVLSVLVGGGLGVLLAIALENFDQTFRTGEEVEDYVGLPVLSLVPTMKSRRRAPDYVVKEPYSPFANSLRMLATKLLLESGSARTARLIMFTSALPGEGKSQISSSLAQVLGLEGLRVAVLDLDWRQPSLQKLFGQPPGPGIADVLHGRSKPEDVVHRDRKTGVDAYFAGSNDVIRGNPASLERLRTLLAVFAKRYDVVILDTPPAAVSPEVLHLARLVERTIFVVRWAATPRRMVANEIKNFLRTGGAVAGIVLSQVNARQYSQYGDAGAAYLQHRYLAQTAT